MTKRFRPVMGALVASALVTMPVMAAQYEIQPVTGADGKVAACQAINASTGVLFMAAGSQVLLFATTSKFPFAEGDEVTGTWSVDGSAPAAFTSDGAGANMVAFDVPNTAQAVTLLTTGKRLDITANKIKASFDMAGTADAFTGLIACLTKASQ